ncbi:hypothetical protein Tco_0462000 [Tanacetum coccineum]
MKHAYSNDDTCFSIDVIDEILEQDFDALLNKGSKILHSIEGTFLEEEIFAEFDEFMAITADENPDFESNTEKPPFEKITINTERLGDGGLWKRREGHKIKTSLEEPPTDLELKPLPDNLEYHKIQLLDNKKPVVQKQRRLNPNMQEVVKKEIVKLLDTGIIYPIADSPWATSIHRVPKKGGITVVTNENDELEKCHFMVKEGIVLGHKVSSAGLEVNKAKIDVISKLPPPNIKEIKDRKGTENVVADHLSLIENNESSDDSNVDDNFLGETLMEINTKDEPWFVDFANYLVAGIIPKGMMYQQKNKFFSDLKHYFWEEPYLFKAQKLATPNSSFADEEKKKVSIITS